MALANEAKTHLEKLSHSQVHSGVSKNESESESENDSPSPFGPPLLLSIQKYLIEL